EQPKAFAKLGEDPLLAESLRRLDDSEWIDVVVVVVPSGWEEPAILLAEELGCGKVSACVAGGEARAGCVPAGAAEVPADGGRVKVVPGDPRLLKVTTAEDLARIASWL